MPRAIDRTTAPHREVRPPSPTSQVSALGWVAATMVCAGALVWIGQQLPPLPAGTEQVTQWLTRHGTGTAAASVAWIAAVAALGYLVVVVTLTALGTQLRPLADVADALPGRWARTGARALVGATVGAGLVAAGPSVMVAPAGATGPPTVADSDTTAVAGPHDLDPSHAEGSGAPSVDGHPMDRDEVAVPSEGPTRVVVDLGSPASAAASSRDLPPAVVFPLDDARSSPGSPPTDHRPGPSDAPAGATATGATQRAGAPATNDEAASTGRTHDDVAAGTDASRRSVVTMRSLDDIEPVATDEHTADPESPSPASSPADDEQWEVALGDHLWAIAAEMVADVHEHPSDDTISAYWSAMVDANRDRLVDPANPDLLLPGQVLVLPPMAAAGS